MRRPSGTDVAVTAAFAILAAVNLAHHAMWRDETLAWQIAAASHSFADLFDALHYDGHPGLWHALLWPLAHAWPHPEAIKLIHGAIALGIILLIGLASPFSRPERALILAGYFLIFEYSAISRDYAPGLLLALLYAALRSRAPQRALVIGAVLALMANTNVYAAMLSAALALEYFLSRRDRPGIAMGAALYLAGLALAIATVWPAPDLSRDVVDPLADAASPGHFVRTLLRFATIGLVPIRDGVFRGGFLLDMPEHSTPLQLIPYALAALALWFALWRIFRRRPRLLLILALTLLAAATFGHLVYAVAIRHWGILFVAFLACLWMLRASGERPNAIAAVLLLLGAVGGLQSLALQWNGQPFSMAPAAAEWLHAHTAASDRLVVAGDAQGSNVAARLGRDMTMLECRCTGPRYVQNAARDGFTRTDLVPRLAQLSGAAPAVLVSIWELTSGEEAALRGEGVRAVKLIDLTGAWTDENFHLYRLTPIPLMPGPPASAPSSG